MKILHDVDDLLNNLTMYRLMVYGLSLLAAICFLFAVGGILTQTPASLAVSLGAIMIVGYLTNYLLAQAWKVTPNFESGLITCLILFFLLPPATTDVRLIGAVGVTIIAIASKFLLAYRRRHIFNPAAVGLVIGGLLNLTFGAWWVGNGAMYLLVLFFGILIARKLRRVTMVMVFLFIAVAVNIVVTSLNDGDLLSSSRLLLTSSPLLFLGMVMLTEPSTMPPTERGQLIYAALVGSLFTSQINIGNQLVTGEWALVIGNLFAFAVSPRYKLKLRLVDKHQLAPNIYDFVFESDRQPKFAAGQYIDLTLGKRWPDGRGNRRTFTIASSPTEKQLHFGIRTNSQHLSSFKTDLMNLKPGQSLIAGPLAGNFSLPADPSQKLVFVAGGIGVTPFRSMAQYLIDSNQQRDIVLVYLISDPRDAVYVDIFVKAAANGLKLIKIITSDQVPSGWSGLSGRLTAETWRRAIPDAAERKFYISGPPGLVDDQKALLKGLGVKKIVTDHFSGY